MFLLLQEHKEEKPIVCDQCPMAFLTTSDLSKHKRNHANTTSYACVDCGKSFKSKKLLGRHTTKHKPVPCSYCHKLYPKSYIDMHLRTHTGEKPYGCKLCPRKFMRQGDLKRHNAIHLGDTPYQCGICDKRFVLKRYLRIHMAIHKDVKPFECKECSKRFAQKGALVVHVQRLHEERERAFRCEQCGRGYKSKINLNQHRLRHIHTEVKPHVCKTCPKTFKTKAEIIRHTRTHAHEGALLDHVKPLHEERERAFKCEQCGRGYTSKKILNQHRKIHTDVKPHVCETCPKTFKTKDELIRHTRSHTGEKPYECDICHQRFAQSGARNNHKKTHTGEKPFQCEFCPQLFARKGYIAAHVKWKHTNDRRFSCGICDYTGVNRISLVKHMKVHTGVKEFVCDICQHACSTKVNLIVHMRTHTGEKPYTCDVCGERFSHQNSRITHLWRKHKVGGRPKRKTNGGNKHKAKNAPKQKTSNDSRQNFNDGTQFAKDLNKHQVTTGNLPVTVNVNHDAAYLNMQTKNDWKLKASVLSESCPAVVLHNSTNRFVDSYLPHTTSPTVSKAISTSSNQNISINIDNCSPSDISRNKSQTLEERLVDTEAIRDRHTDTKPETNPDLMEEIIISDQSISVSTSVRNIHGDLSTCEMNHINLSTISVETLSTTTELHSYTNVKRETQGMQMDQSMDLDNSSIIEHVEFVPGPSFSKHLKFVTMVTCLSPKFIHPN